MIDMIEIQQPTFCSYLHKKSVNYVIIISCIQCIYHLFHYSTLWNRYTIRETIRYTIREMIHEPDVWDTFSFGTSNSTLPLLRNVSKTLLIVIKNIWKEDHIHHHLWELKAFPYTPTICLTKDKFSTKYLVSSYYNMHACYFLETKKITNLGVSMPQHLPVL